MKALKTIAVIALIVGLVWIVYLTVFDSIKTYKPELIEEKEEKEEVVEPKEDDDYVPNKILKVKTEEDIEKEKKEVKINTPLDPFGKQLKEMEDSNFKSIDPDEYPGGIDASVKQNGTWISEGNTEYKYKKIEGSEVQSELGYYFEREKDSYQPIESIRAVFEDGSSITIKKDSLNVDRDAMLSNIDRNSSYRKKMYYYNTGKFKKIEYIYMLDAPSSGLSDEIITGEKVIEQIKNSIPNFYSEQKAYLISIGKDTNKKIEDPLLKISVNNGTSGSFDLTDDLHPADIYINGINKYAKYRYAREYYEKGNTKSIYYQLVE